MARTPTYPLGLPDDQRERFQKAAAAHGVSLAEWIRQSCEMRIRDGNQPVGLADELAEARDLLGMPDGKRSYDPDPKIRTRDRSS